MQLFVKLKKFSLKLQWTQRDPNRHTECSQKWPILNKSDEETKGADILGTLIQLNGRHTLVNAFNGQRQMKCPSNPKAGTSEEIFFVINRRQCKNMRARDKKHLSHVKLLYSI
jgi:hypothetical protein